MTRRSGFTLLEMVLALSIGVVLLGALYLTMDSQLRLVDAGRETLDEAAVARAIFARIDQDLSACLGAVDPRLSLESNADANSTGGSSGANSTGGGGSSGGSSPSSSSPTNGNTAGSNASTSNSNNASGSDGSANNTIIFNCGIRGDGLSLDLSSSKPPREVIGRDTINANVSDLPKVSDLRRTIYWYVEGLGLARRETSNATGNDLNYGPSDFSDPSPYIIAPEVQGMTIQYFDGTANQATWDSTALTSDTQIQLGPPSALLIELTIGRPNGPTRIWRHTIAIPTSNQFQHSGS